MLICNGCFIYLLRTLQYFYELIAADNNNPSDDGTFQDDISDIQDIPDIPDIQDSQESMQSEEFRKHKILCHNTKS